MIEDGITIDSPWLDLRRADCMDLMKESDDKRFDLAIVDPPYGINFAKQHTGKGWVVRASKDWDKTPPQAEYFDELRRVSKEYIVWGANYFTHGLPPSPGWVFWDKGQRNFSLADGELAFTSFNRALRCVTITRGEMNAEYVGQKFHPTTKPVQLYKWLLTNYARPGQRILDTHMGSGSIAIACHYFGAHLTACEIDEDYFRAACERIERETRQGTLWEGAMP